MVDGMDHLLERDGVLRQLRGLVVRALEGHGQIALVRGEAGIGKTSVVRELAQSVSREVAVRWGTCDDLLAPRPLHPVWDMALREPALADVLAQDDHDRVLQALVERFTRPGLPTVAVFEDVHWADGATLDLLTTLGRRVRRSNTVLVLTFRERVVDGHPLAGVLGDLPATEVTSIELEPLTPDAVTSMSGDPERGRQIWNLTSGNPFLVSELIDDPTDGVPVSVQDSMRARVARLTAKGERLVLLASVVPGELELDLLDHIYDNLRSVVGEVHDLGLLCLRGDSIAFRHELARVAIEATLSEPVRRELNLKVLRACESVGVDVSRTAHHARRANDPRAMARLLPDAALQAAGARSHREALSHLQALEPHLDRLPPVDRADLYELWATEEELVSGRGLTQALASVDLRRTLGDPADLGNALLRASRSAFFEGDPARSLTLAEDAVEVLADIGGERLAHAYAWLSRRAQADHQPGNATRYADRALALSPAPSQARAIALVTLGTARSDHGQPELGDDLLREAEDMSQGLGLERDWQIARGNRILTALVWFHLARGTELNEEALASIGDDTTSEAVFHLAVRAAIRTLAGDFDDAEVILRELEDRENVEGSIRVWIAHFLAQALMRKGDANAPVAVRRFDELARTSEGQDQVSAATRWAEYLWSFGEQDEAVTRGNLEVLQQVPRDKPWDLGNLALWLWLDGHIAEIPDDAAEPIRWLGEGGWQRTADWFSQRGRPYEQAVALGVGDLDAQVEALRIAGEIGARALAARYRRHLQADGVTGLPRPPREATRHNPLGLTARQGEVLGLLVEGLTNRAIADQMFISPRTVEKHVDAVRTRLGASDRHHAVVRAIELGLHEDPEGAHGEGNGQA